MKILYSIQATGNGHISRAMELLPHLQKHGKVHLFLSGSNSTLELNAPVKYRSKGLSLFYTCHGGLNFRKTVWGVSPGRVISEARALPVEKYDLILNDFECITSIACRLKKFPSVHFGHQASFFSEHTPRPENKSRTGEFILKNYVKSRTHIGLHFEQYDSFILPPVIRKDVWDADVKNKGFISVYLPSYCNNQLKNCFHKFPDFFFEIFSWQVKEELEDKNIRFIPVSSERFGKSMAECMGIITGAGFETPAEALYMKKKIMAIPITGQYEQACNAAALKRLGVKIIEKIDDDFPEHFNHWMNNNFQVESHFFKPTDQILQNVLEIATHHQEMPDFGFDSWAFS